MDEKFWYSSLFTRKEMRDLSDYDLATYIMYEHLFLQGTKINNILTDEDLEDIIQDIYLIILKNKKNNRQRSDGLRLDSIVKWTHRIFQKYINYHNKCKPIEKYVNKMNKMINFRREK